MFYKTVLQESRKFSYFRTSIILMLLALTLLLNYADTPPSTQAAPAALNQAEAPLLEASAPLACTSTDVGGHVYREFNMNGIADPALYESEVWPPGGSTEVRQIRYAEGTFGGVIVKAYDDDNTLIGSAVSQSDGSWSIDASAASGGKVRVEFTPPAGFENGILGSDNGTDVVFASLGSCTVNHTVGKACDHCQDDPQVAFAQFAHNQKPAAEGTIKSFAYSSGHPFISKGITSDDANTFGDPEGSGGTNEGDYTFETDFTYATTTSVGSILGLAWDSEHELLFASAFDRAFAPMGPGGESAIYSVTRAGAVLTWLNLDTLLGADTAGIDVPQNNWNGSRGQYETTPDVIGHLSLGSLKLSADNRQLYVVNLFTKEVYVIPIGANGQAPTQASDIKVFPVPVPANCTGSWSDEIAPGVNRPYLAMFGLGVHPDGRVYATTTCTGPTVDDMAGYIYSFDPTDTTPSSSDFRLETSLPLNLPQLKRGLATTRAILYPWADGLRPNVGSLSIIPMELWLGEIEFDIRPDGSSNMITILRNRLYDMTSQNYSVAGGVAMRVCNLGTPVSPQWEFELDGVCGGETSNNDLLVTNGLTTLPFFINKNERNKFYNDIGEEGPLFVGTLALAPGFAEFVAGGTDNIAHNAYSGFTWVNTSGQRSRDNLVTNDSLSGYAKSNNWGDVEVLCDAAPLEIGNRLWCDDGNGTQDPLEPAVLDGVTVQLVCDTDGDGFGVGTDLTATTTTSGGSYLFNSSNVSGGVPYNSSCRVIIDNAEASNATIINNSCGSNTPAPSTQTNPLGDGNDEARDSDGAVITGVTGVGVEFSTGGPGESDHDYDFGFQQTTVADRGDLPDSFDTTISQFGPFHALTADLYLGSCVDNDANGQPDAEAGMDGIGGDDSAAGSPVLGTCTNDDDEDGVSLTTPLIAGTQACVEVDALNSGAAANLYGWIDFNGDGDFDGDADDLLSTGDFAGGSIAVNGNLTDQQYCFTVPAAATFDGGETHMRFRLTRDDLSSSSTPWNGAASDGEVEDYWQSLACIGNYVWDDLHGTTSDVQDADDTPLSGVAVRLVWADGNGVIDTGAGDAVAQVDDVLYTTTTDANGAYQFCGLVPDEYQVQITTPPGGAPQAITPDQGGNDVTDSDGSQPGGTGTPVSSPTFTIPDPTNTLPTGENGNEDNPGSLNNYPDNQDDLTLDFGFGPAQVAIGNYVWRDADGNGLQDGGESGIENVTVQLLDSSGDPALCYLGSNGVSANYADDFETNGSTGSTGSLTWTNDWQLTGAVTWPSIDGDLAMALEDSEAALREFDMTAFPFGTATLNYSYRFGNGIDPDETVTVAYFDGSSWNTLVVYDDATDLTIFTAQSFTINSTVATTQIRFTANASGEDFYVDDIDISGTTDGPVTTVTDAAGLYLFDERDCLLPSTNYQVVIDTNQTPLMGINLTVQNAGSDDALDSDAAMVDADAIINAALSPATGENLSYDFGFTTATIGNYVWNDTNGDGLQDGGEAGIEGVTVQLLDSGGSPVLCAFGSHGVPGNYADDFESNGSSGSVGSLTWTNDWQLTGAVTWASIDGDLAMRLDPAEIALREFDMTAFPFGTATFSYAYRFASTIGTGDTVTVDYFDGTVWNTLVVYDSTTDPTTFTAQSFTINSTSVNTQIRFSSNAGGEIFYVDDVDISGTIPGSVSNVTDAAGLYMFDGGDCLDPSTTYQVVVDTDQATLTGFILTAQNAGSDDALDSDAAMVDADAVINAAASPATGENLSYDFGFTTVAIGNYVWRDANSDGFQDGGEVGIEGVTVQLLNSGGSPALCHLGSYGAPGNYADDFQSSSPSGSTGSLSWANDWQLAGTTSWADFSGDIALRLNSTGVVLREFDMTAFPIGTATLSYSYRFWNDIDAGETVTVDYFDGSVWHTLVVYDNTTDPTTFTAQNFTINSTAANTQIRFSFNAGDETFYFDDVDISGTIAGLVTDVTDADGLYLFDGGDCVDPSTTYRVVIDTVQAPLTGFFLTTQNAGSVTNNDPVADDNDSDAAMVGTDAVINPAPSPAIGENPGYDFGFSGLFNISGYVWDDSGAGGDNLNGIYDSGEPIFANTTVVLVSDPNGTPVCQSVQTDANGFYEFTDLPPGEYQIIEAAGESVPIPSVCTPDGADPDGYTSITPNVINATIVNADITEQNFGDFQALICECTTIEVGHFLHDSNDLEFINLITGAIIPAAGTLTQAIDAGGYSLASHYFYGTVNHTNHLGLIDFNYQVVDFGEVPGLPVQEYIAGDVSSDGKLYLLAEFTQDTLYVVDVDPNSATYTSLLASISLSGYSLNLLGDVARNPIDGALYGFDYDGTTPYHLVRINPVSGVVDDLGTLRDINGDPVAGTDQFGAAYFTSGDGKLFGYKYSSSMWMVDLSDTAAYDAPAVDPVALEMVDLPEVPGGGEGARCSQGPTTPLFDYGDVPDSYSTLDASGGPKHDIQYFSQIRMGKFVHQEPDGVPSVDALGDDIDDGSSNDDEDGVGNLDSLPQNDVSYSVTVTVTNRTGGDATLLGWIDFNGNGIFEAGEATTVTVADGIELGTATLNWTGLSGLVSGDTYLRLRLTTDPTITASTPGGAASDGEVEDHPMQIGSYDWGDLPDTVVGTGIDNYNTNSGDNGPRHLLDGVNYLGDCVDVEGSGQPDTEAGYDVVGGDDGSSGTTTGTCAVAGDDEDGIDSPVGLGNGTWGDGTGDLNVTGLVGSGCLAAWVDWNSDGDFDDTPNGVSELIYAGSLTSGPHALAFPTQVDSDHGGSYDYPTSGVLNARFRLFTAAQLSTWGVACDSAGVSSRYTGSAVGGEVEDYQWSFNSPTAVSLDRINAATSPVSLVIIFILVLGLLLAAVTVTAVYSRRRQIH